MATALVASAPVSLRHANEPVSARKRARAAGRAAGEAPDAASVLALQRSIGNAATRQLMRNATQDRFKVVIVRDGETGLSQAAMTKAVAVVKQELAKVAGGSDDAAVRKGFVVDYRQSDGDLTGLHQRVFLVYLMQGKDADKAVALARPHLPKGYDSDLKDAAHELNSIGGANLRIDFNGRSPSVSLASTGALADFVKGRADGDRVAGQLLGEIILHEIGTRCAPPTRARASCRAVWCSTPRRSASRATSARTH